MKRPALRRLALQTFGVLFLLAQLSSAAPTPAQIVARRVARLTALLSLTSAQQSQATTIFTTEQTTISGLETSLQAARTALEAAIQKNDSGSINTEATEIGNVTAQRVLAQATANAAFYAILTPAQQTTYNNLKLTGFAGGRGFHGYGR